MYILELDQSEMVVLRAAHQGRVKSQLSNLKMHVLADSHSWPTLFLLTHLPLGSPDVLLEYAFGGVLFIISHSPHSHSEHTQGLLSPGRADLGGKQGGTWHC